jgi:antitoxin (DNA-binding transcriptional repressor) of toxin-antitoxin stability system
MATASIFKAKTHFSRIIQRVQEGETVVITSGRSIKR